MPTCFICNDNQIEYTTKCQTCSKKVCSKCFTKCKLKVGSEGIRCKCPFCNSETVYDYDEIDNSIIRILHKTNLKSIEKLKTVFDFTCQKVDSLTEKVQEQEEETRMLLTKIDKHNKEVEFRKKIYSIKTEALESRIEEEIEEKEQQIQALMKFRRGFTNHLNSLKAKNRKMINIDELLNLISCE